MEHVLLTLFKSLSKDLIDRAHITAVERRALTISARDDAEYARRRLEKEGSGFFTKTTPAFAKHLMACLEAGSYTYYMGLTHKQGHLPCFMHGWVTRIFDRSTGTVLDSVCTDALTSIRQLLLMANKAKALPSDALCAKAYKEYLDDDTAINQESLWSNSVSAFGYTAQTMDQHFTVDRRWNSIGYLGRMFVQVGRTIGFELESRYRLHHSACRGEHPLSIDGSRWWNGDGAELRPKHGPGAVAERLDDDGKWEHLYSHSNNRLDRAFDTFWINFHEVEEPGSVAADWHNDANRPSRLIAVPKTAATPRLIAAEPCANQFWQQALMGFSADAIRESWLYHSIKMDDQSASQQRAYEGSTSRNLATIDLSKASDSVTLDHIGALFQCDSLLLDGLMSCRTESIDVPGHGVIRLRKFASMGSAVCFPMESLVFLAAVAASILTQDGFKTSLDTSYIREACRRITVYGDDIIVPEQYFVGVLRDLRALGFIPNANKSFAKSLFRESCGVEFYAGVAVKPIYIRQDFWSRDRLTDSDVISLVETSRQMWDAGYLRTARYLLEKCETHLGMILPYSKDSTGYLSHNQELLDRTGTLKTRYNTDLQKLEIGVFVPVPNTSKTELDGYVRLLRYLVTSYNNRCEPDPFDPADKDWSKKTTRGFKLKYRFV